MRRPSPRAGAAALVVAIGLATVPVVGSASESSRVVVQRAAPLPAGASVLAPASATGFDVMLAIPHPGALSAFLADLSDPSSPSYRHFLTPAQFATRFGASLGAVAAVSSYLRGFGLDVGRLSAGHLALHVTGTTGQVARAFDARVVTLRHAGVTGAQLASAATLPANVARDVSGVIGLSSVVGRPVSLVRRAHVALPGSCPSAGSDATTTPQSSGGYTVAQIASAYGISAEWASGDTGQGQTIGLYELAPYSPGDIATFFSCYGITPSVTGVNVDGGSGDAVSEEATFDIEEAAAMAPGAQIVVYTGPNNSTGPNDILLQIADDDLATVVSTSWGDCETDPANDPTAEQPIFEQMAAEGQTMVASSGDSGSSDCSGITNNSPAVDDPASQPYVTSVGGLTVTDTSPLAETVWNDGVHSGGGAGGGGESLVWSKPTWQNGPGVTASESMRMVPDLSTMADPSTSFIDFFTNNFSGACGHCANDWGAIGGTSTGAPLLAAMTSIGANACGVARLGFLNPTLYAMARRGVGFDDVTTGSNDLYGVGVYPAGVGYDMASGLGSPDPSTFFPGLCPIALDASHSSLVASTTSATVPGPVTLTLSARDATGAPIAGAVIKFSASASSGIVEFDSDRSSSTGTGSAAYSVTTDDTGAASVTLTESAAASASVTASSGGATLTTQVTFTELMTSPPGRASVARAVATVGGFRVTARAPLSAGSSAITAYQYSIGSGRWVRFSAATLVAKASHLARHTTYHVRVRALNAFGAGPASAAVAVRTL